MRHFFLFSLLIFPVWSYPCPISLLENYSGPLNCTNLNINTTPDLSAVTLPMVITVTGDVEISADIILDGSHGVLTSGAVAGGSGGPGASEGGYFDGVTSYPGGFNDLDFLSANGQPGLLGASCGGGGGGGGLEIPGENGMNCTGGAGGSAGTSARASLDFDFGLNFRGGFGGGAGGNGAANIAGTGGGGGGAIHIISQTGNIVITRNAKISAKGGNGGGGLGILDGGGGGGGSGGAIWLEAPAGHIRVHGVLDVQGGKGGSNNGGIGGHGGDGGTGVYLLSDSSGTPIEGTGTFSQGDQSLKSFNSSISCGTVASKNDSSNIVQIIAAFLLINSIMILIKRAKRCHVPFGLELFSNSERKTKR